MHSARYSKSYKSRDGIRRVEDYWAITVRGDLVTYVPDQKIWLLIFVDFFIGMYALPFRFVRFLSSFPQILFPIASVVRFRCLYFFTFSLPVMLIVGLSGRYHMSLSPRLSFLMLRS